MIWFLYGLLLILCLAAVWFYCYAMLGAKDLFSRPSDPESRFHPPVTVLKPLCGLDIGAYENLASFCRQDYPVYQVIFGVRDSDDPSTAVVNRLIQNFPCVDIELVVDSRVREGSPKVSNLVNMEGLAKYPTLLISDSDIRVGRDYLRRVVQPLADPAVGAVTCMYRSLNKGFAPTLEALRISTDFVPGLLVARKLEGVKFALGSTILMRREAFNAIGGFPAIAEYLADDFMLGNLIMKAGYRLVLSDYVVEHALKTENLAEMIRREIRWNRGMRVSRPWGYVGLVFTQGIPFSLLFFLLKIGTLIGWAVLAATWGVRLVMGRVIGFHYLKDRAARKQLWLAPVADLIAFGTWAYSFMGNAIEWRGQWFRLTKMGKLVPLPKDQPAFLFRAGFRLDPLMPALSVLLVGILLTAQMEPVPAFSASKAALYAPQQAQVIRLPESEIGEIPPPPRLTASVKPQRRSRPVMFIKKIWDHVDLVAALSSFGTMALKDGFFDKDGSRATRHRDIQSAAQFALMVMWGAGLWKRVNHTAFAVPVPEKEWQFKIGPVLGKEGELSMRVTMKRRF